MITYVNKSNGTDKYKPKSSLQVYWRHRVEKDCSLIWGERERERERERELEGKQSRPVWQHTPFILYILNQEQFPRDAFKGKEAV